MVVDFISIKKVMITRLTLIWVGGCNPPPSCWFSLNNSEMIKAVTLAYCSIQWHFIRDIPAKFGIPNLPQSLNSTKVRVFFEKSTKKKHLCCYDKNYHHFCKSNIPEISLIVGSRNIIKVSKNMSLWKIKLTARVIFTKYRQFLSVFWMG